MNHSGVNPRMLFSCHVGDDCATSLLSSTFLPLLFCVISLVLIWFHLGLVFPMFLFYLRHFLVPFGLFVPLESVVGCLSIICQWLPTFGLIVFPMINTGFESLNECPFIIWGSPGEGIYQVNALFIDLL